MILYDHFRNKKVLVTGHTGFKGSWLTMWLLKMNAHVYGISDRVPTQPAMFTELGLNKKTEHQFCDIRDYEKTEKAILDIEPDYLFHLAAQPIVSEAYNDPLTTLSTNIMGTAHILEALKKLKNNCTAVFITSDKCYENVEQVWGYREIDHLGGKDIYSASKGSAEIVIHAFFHSFFGEKKPNVRIASARAGNVIGGGDFSPDRLVPDCMRAWSNKKKVTIRSPYSTRPWQHVLEPLSGYLWLAAKLNGDKKLNGQSFNLGPKDQLNLTVLDVIDQLSQHWGFNSADNAYGYTRNDNFKEAGLLKLNCDKAHHLLNWEATLNHKETMKQVSRWYSDFYSGKVNMYDFTLSQISEYELLAEKRNMVWASTH